MWRNLEIVVLSGMVAARIAAAETSELERLRAENARLKARVAELEGDKARLERQSTGPLVAALEHNAAESVQVETDQTTGATTTTTAPSELTRLDGARTRQWLTLRAARSGERVGAPAADVRLIIETAATTGAYKNAKVLRLSMDGVAQELAVVDYRSEAVTAGRTPARVAEREIVVVGVPLDTLARMAEAREVQGTLGALGFRLTPEQLASVRAFRQRVNG